VERLERDRVVLEKNIGDEGMQTLAEVLRVTSEGLGRPDFVVVFGSRARQAGDDESDVDLCFEASWVPADPERMPRIRERQDELVFDMMAFPRGLLLARLRVRDEVARAVVGEGRVYSDGGTYRAIAIVADEEDLL
jgi:predicted nucleotidyltransferase